MSQMSVTRLMGALIGGYNVSFDSTEMLGQCRTEMLLVLAALMKSTERDGRKACSQGEAAQAIHWHYLRNASVVELATSARFPVHTEEQVRQTLAYGLRLLRHPDRSGELVRRLRAHGKLQEYPHLKEERSP